MEELILIDIGGTTIKFGVMHKGELEVFNAVKTPKTLAGFYEVLTTNVTELKKSYPAKGVAISSPGAVDKKEGVIKGASAIPYIHNFKIQKKLSELFDLPVSLENDANCAALAEIYTGAGKDANNAIFLVIGTGLGGAVVIDKKVYHGSHLLAGEFGYRLTADDMIVSQAVSPVSLAKRYTEKTGKNVTGKEVFELAKTGDEFAELEVDRAVKVLANLIYDLQYSFDPELFIIGGAISENKDLIPMIEQELTKILQKVKIVDLMPKLTVCHHRKNANLLGAALDFIRTERNQ